MRFRSRPAADRVEINMTPMIDVVFQLLAFFIVSFKVVLPEGDLGLKMPRVGGEGSATACFDAPLRVHLQADGAGRLVGIELAGQTLGDTAALRKHIEQIVALSPDIAETMSVDLVCDTGLHYQYAIAALTAVSGKRNGDRVFPLASNVRLVPAQQ